MMSIKKISLIVVILVLSAIGFNLLTNTKKVPDSKMTVFHSKTCGCCLKWISYLKDSGIQVETHAVDDVSGIKTKHGVSGDLASCHTALIDGYVIEGHVPLAAIEKLLKERPNIKGLSVPGMPAGSPGMEGSHSEKYDVIAFGKEGKKVFMSFNEGFAH